MGCKAHVSDEEAHQARTTREQGIDQEMTILAPVDRL